MSSQGILVSKSVLVVCMGNICRSPYAERKLKSLQPNLEVASAGLATKVSKLAGKSADATATKAAVSFGIDLNGHKAQQVTEKLVAYFDVILVMESSQLKTLCELYPWASHKVTTFGYWNNITTIDDPYQRGLHAFRRAFFTIDRAAAEWNNRL